MRLHWENSIEVPIPVERVYAYLADFSKHGEWARTLERMELVREGDSSGVGARYITHERLEFKPGGKASSSRTMCEVRELVPDQRIAWHAHPLPRVGSAELCFDLTPTPDGGTRITQTVKEYYPAPIALMMRVMWNITEDGIRKQLDAGLQTLKETLLTRTWDAPAPAPAAPPPAPLPAA
jgi:uncharacterized protein YndB with AHSA1/START domain